MTVSVSYTNFNVTNVKIKLAMSQAFVTGRGQIQYFS